MPNPDSRADAAASSSGHHQLTNSTLALLSRGPGVLSYHPANGLADQLRQFSEYPRAFQYFHRGKRFRHLLHQHDSLHPVVEVPGPGHRHLASRIMKVIISMKFCENGEGLRKALLKVHVDPLLRIRRLRAILSMTIAVW